MTKLDDCANEHPITREWLEGHIEAGRSTTPEITRRLAGMLLRGDTLKSAAPPASTERVFTRDVVEEAMGDDDGDQEDESLDEDEIIEG